MENKNRLFYASCFALITTAFSFSIRAGILGQLGTEYQFTAEQLSRYSRHFMLPEVGLGALPPIAMVRLPRLIGARRTLELAVTRRKLTAPEAYALGLEEVAEQDSAIMRFAYSSMTTPEEVLLMTAESGD